MKIQPLYILLVALILSACHSRQGPPITDDTLMTTEVGGVVLTYRHAIQPPISFTHINEEYRALYKASVMSRSDYGGNVVRYLDNSQTFTVLGVVENEWLAIAETGDTQLIGYIPPKAGVRSELYEATVKADRFRPARKSVCVKVDGNSKACRDNSTATWILH